MMQKILLIILTGLTVLFLSLSVFLWLQVRKVGTETKIDSHLLASIFAQKNDFVLSKQIEPEQTFGQIVSLAGIPYPTMLAIMESAEDVYDLTTIKAGNEISFLFADNGKTFYKLIYQINADDVFVGERGGDGTWKSERLPIPYEETRRQIEGTIESSLFQTFIDKNLDTRVALALAEMFAWQVDFSVDIRTGDSFRAIYEERFLNDEYVMPGDILAAEFTNNGKKFQGIFFKTSDKKRGFYDLEGNSLQKIFLKSPLSYKYISSGFSYNRRNPITRTDWGPHRAIDYAAPYGTPVVTVGDGTVAHAGWKGQLGIIVQVRHNETYTTVYAHLSRTAVRTGQRVNQGQVIGYVGATGYATGPHLHFEMHKFGNYVNPLIIELPPGDPVPEKDKKEFEKTRDSFKEFFKS